ncbi:MAG TPA: hypothetical protein VFB58_02000 [Chloroflexota bacterium]|nr:hypothetical protein [Chloroflexota bacterium]
MSDGQFFLILILTFFVVKIFIAGPLLFMVFRDDIRRYWAGRKQKAHEPCCPGCASRYAAPLDEGVIRWEGDDLVLVTGYQCQHCGYPFWHVERVPMGKSGLFAGGSRDS